MTKPVCVLLKIFLNLSNYFASCEHENWVKVVKGDKEEKKGNVDAENFIRR